MTPVLIEFPPLRADVRISRIMSVLGGMGMVALVAWLFLRARQER